MRMTAAVVALACAVATAAAQSPHVTVFAASDLGPPFKAIIPEFEKRTGTKVTLVLGSTGMLTQQIRNGAPADVFFAANADYIAQLETERLTLPHTKSLYARGQIVAVTLRSGRVRVNSLKDLSLTHIRRVALANPAHAPYGLAAKQALEHAGIWPSVQPKLVYGENVQQAVQFVRSGSADVGIVARSVAGTDDLISTGIDANLYRPLDQFATVLKRTRDPGGSAAFIEFVNGLEGRRVMRRFGFSLPGEDP